ncbi:MAG: ORF6N domain-containing protein [Nitrospirae bacterium]|nr:ORF6N domain-containing protein [Nitrospirota bacterium]
MLKKSIHGFFSHDLREVNSRKSFKSLDFKSSRFGGASLHRTQAAVLREEFANLRSQIVTSSWGGRRYPPYVFTEHGVAMLSSVLLSPRAVQANIAIMRAFVRLRETLAIHKELAAKLMSLERKIAGHDESIRTLFEAIRQLMAPPEKARRKIGFRVGERGPAYRVRRLRRGSSR